MRSFAAALFLITLTTTTTSLMASEENARCRTVYEDEISKLSPEHRTYCQTMFPYDPPCPVRNTQRLCGRTGNIEERIQDCREKNMKGSTRITVKDNTGDRLLTTCSADGYVCPARSACRVDILVLNRRTHNFLGEWLSVELLANEPFSLNQIRGNQND